MPRERQLQLVLDLEELAALQKLTEHPNVKLLTGEFAGWFLLRAGVYRAIFQPRREDGDEILYVDYIGPRGDAY